MFIRTRLSLNTAQLDFLTSRGVELLQTVLAEPCVLLSTSSLSVSTIYPPRIHSLPAFVGIQRGTTVLLRQSFEGEDD